MCQKIARSIALINQTKQFMPYKVLMSLYYSQVMPHLTYCLPIWGSTYPSLTQPLFLLQKKVIRIITNSGFDDHTNPLFFSSGILKFYDLVKLEIGCFMYKNITNNVFNRLLHDYNTRNRNNLVTPQHDLTLFQKSLKFQGPKIWNTLNDNIKNTRTLFNFKKQYKLNLLNNYQTD